jgi:putative transposase
MARPLRIEYPGALYHVTARGNEGKPIFRDERDRQGFLDRVASVVTRYRLVLHAYVLMRNHYHLLVETPEGGLAAAMRHLNGVYTQDFNRRHQRSGHLFQGRYKALVVDREAYLLELSRYIHLNPVRVSEVGDPAAFGWSSAAAYVGKRPAPPFLTVRPVLQQFGRRLPTARRRYREFLAEGVRAPVAPPWSQVVGQTLLGPPRWRQRLQRHVRRRGVHPEVPASGQLRSRPPLSVVLAQLARAAGVRREDLVRRGGDRGGWARPAAMALGWEVCGLGHRELGTAFGVGHFAVSKAIHRLQSLSRTDQKIKRIVDELSATFQT